MKFNKISCGHMTSHFDRSAKNISNENIDESKTNLNYNLADQSMQQMSHLAWGA